MPNIITDFSTNPDKCEETDVDTLVKMANARNKLEKCKQLVNNGTLNLGDNKTLVEGFLSKVGGAPPPPGPPHGPNAPHQSSPNAPRPSSSNVSPSGSGVVRAAPIPLTSEQNEILRILTDERFNPHLIEEVLRANPRADEADVRGILTTNPLMVVMGAGYTKELSDTALRATMGDADAAVGLIRDIMQRKGSDQTAVMQEIIARSRSMGASMGADDGAEIVSVAVPGAMARGDSVDDELAARFENLRRTGWGSQRAEGGGKLRNRKKSKKNKKSKKHLTRNNKKYNKYRHKKSRHKKHRKKSTTRRITRKKRN